MMEMGTKSIQDTEWEITIFRVPIGPGWNWLASSKSNVIKSRMYYYPTKTKAATGWQEFAKLNGIENWSAA